MSEVELESAQNYLNTFRERYEINQDDLRVFLFDAVDMMLEETIKDHAERSRAAGALVMRLYE